MKYITYLLAIISLITLSCNRGVIPQSDMPKIIADMYMADRFVTSDYKLVLKADTLKIYEAVFRKHGYTSSQFVNTIDFYMTRPAKLKEFYAKAKEILEAREQNITHFLESKTNEENKLAPYRKLKESAGEIVSYSINERALRWIMLPESYPDLRISAGDSLLQMYETPQMSRWWGNNFIQDTTKYRLILKNEKTRSTIHLSPKLSPTGLQRDDNPR